MPCEASLSRFGVFPDIMPRWYAPMLNQPTSSPMMTSMFGGRCCCAVAGKAASVKVDSATALVQTRLRILMVCFLRFNFGSLVQRTIQMIFCCSRLIPDFEAIDVLFRRGYRIQGRHAAIY